jgi:hypothetical protein
MDTIENDIQIMEIKIIGTVCILSFNAIHASW